MASPAEKLKLERIGSLQNKPEGLRDGGCLSVPLLADEMPQPHVCGNMGPL